MRERAPYWRKIETVALPGDEADILAHDIARAIRRDARLNPEEYYAKLCIAQQLQYGLDFCFIEGCPDCDTPAWERWEQAKAVGLF